MILPEMTGSARVARACKRFTRRGGLVGLALGVLAACTHGGGGGSGGSTPEMTITPYRQVVQTLAVAADNSRLVQTPFSAQLGRPPINNIPQAQQVARTEYNNFPPADFNPSSRTTAQITAAWTALAVTAATAYCAAQPRGDDPDDPAYAYQAESAATVSGSEGWAYSSNQNTYANTYQYYARKTRPWTATCERTVRRRE